MEGRERRIAENEARFREINERLARDLGALPGDGEIVAFVCECGMVDCADAVQLTIDEYRRVRQDPMMFVTLPGHEIPDVEDVASSSERFVVVRKHAEASPIVDPE